MFRARFDRLRAEARTQARGSPEDENSRRAQAYRLGLMLLWPLMDLTYPMDVPAEPGNVFLEPFVPILLPPEFMQTLLGGA